MCPQYESLKPICRNLFSTASLQHRTIAGLEHQGPLILLTGAKGNTLLAVIIAQLHMKCHMIGQHVNGLPQQQECLFRLVVLPVKPHKLVKPLRFELFRPFQQG